MLPPPPRTRVLLCDECLPDDAERLTLATLTDGQCALCGKRIRWGPRGGWYTWMNQADLAARRRRKATTGG